MIIRIHYLLALLLICSCVFGLFQVKFRVQNLHREVAELQKQLDHEKSSIHVLKAEWTYLNQPERLQRLAEKFLNLSEVKSDQIMLTVQGSIITAQKKVINNPDAITNNQLIQTSMNSSNKSIKPAKIKWRYRERPDLSKRKK